MIRPFHCGSQFADWTARNCSRCSKGWDEVTNRNADCDIEEELLLAYFGSGEITKEIADRMGYTNRRVYGWDCLERKME